MSAFDKWRSKVSIGPKVVVEKDDKKKDCPTPQELAELKTKKSDLSAILTVFKCDDNSSTTDIVDFTEKYWKAYGNFETLEKFIYQGSHLDSVVLERMNKQLKKMTADDKIDTVHDIVATINLRRGLVIVELKKHADMLDYSFNLAEGIMKHQTIVLFSTVDIAFLSRVMSSTSDHAFKKQLEYFHARNMQALAKLDGSIESARLIPQTTRGVPISDAFALKEFNTTKKYAAERENTVALTFQEEPFSLVEIGIKDENYPSKQSIEDQFVEWKNGVVKIVFDMRASYYRYRGWLAARLTWSGDDEPLPAVKKRAPSQRKPKEKKQAPPLENPTPPIVVLRSQGLFEKGIHPQQSKLNDLYRVEIPIVDAADDVAGEILRLSVLAYQLAFDGVPLDSILIEQSGTMLNGKNVFTEIVKPRLVEVGLDTSKAINADQRNFDQFDAYLEQILSVHDRENEAFDDETVLGRYTTRQKELRTGFYNYVLDFFWHYYLQPFGPMGILETRVRAALKSQILGRVPSVDILLFTKYELAMLVGSPRERFDILTYFVEQLTRYYIETGRMFRPPNGTPVDERVQFTNNFAIAHKHAQASGDIALPRRLAEIFDMLGPRSTLNYGQTSLNDYLYEKSGKRTRSFYYTLADGLVPGADVGTVGSVGYVFKYIVYEETHATSEHALKEDEDDDGEPDLGMHVDAKIKNPAKYARFDFDGE